LSSTNNMYSSRVVNPTTVNIYSIDAGNAFQDAVSVYCAVFR
jgi:hypothetical protein